jgi:hypothetical protein
MFQKTVGGILLMQMMHSRMLIGFLFCEHIQYEIAKQHVSDAPFA